MACVVLVESLEKEEVMEAQLGLAMASMLAGSWRWEGISAYPGPMTQELVVQSHATSRQAAEHSLAAAAAAPEAASEAGMRSFAALMMIYTARQHGLPYTVHTRYRERREG